MVVSPQHYYWTNNGLLIVIDGLTSNKTLYGRILSDSDINIRLFDESWIKSEATNDEVNEVLDKREKTYLLPSRLAVGKALMSAKNDNPATEFEAGYPWK
jgi:hypothetical protein